MVVSGIDGARFLVSSVLLVVVSELAPVESGVWNTLRGTGARGAVDDGPGSLSGLGQVCKHGHCEFDKWQLERLGNLISIRNQIGKVHKIFDRL